MSNPDFQGWATKNDIRCSDGRVIRRDAFLKNNGKRVPLVWQHGHGSIDNVIGHAELENRPEGVYTYGYLNDTPQAEIAKDLLAHGDVNSLSIFANRLQQRGSDVIHGNIVEVSLVLSGANPGAMITNVTIQHDDGSFEDSEEEAIIHTDLQLEEDAPVADATEALEHADEEAAPEETKTEDAKDGKSVKAILNSFTEEQKTVLYYMVAIAAGGTDGDASAEHSDSDQEGNDTMAHSSVFEGNAAAFAFVNKDGKGFTHSELTQIADDVVRNARENGLKLSDVLAHAEREYGISNVEELFPNAKELGKPVWVKPEDDWVPEILDKVSRTPFAVIKSTQIDLTEDQLRAKGYIRADQKKDGVFSTLSRKTHPQTVYIRSKLDRDDIIDVTDHDIVAYVKEAMKIKFRYELGRALLVGDGREPSDREKIQPENIRPIWTEDDFYAPKLVLPSTVTNEDLIEPVLRGRKNFKGHGQPVMFTTFDVKMDLLLQKDKNGRYIYETEQALCAKLQVSKIVVVDEMENKSRTTDDGEQELVAILLNPNDYTIGANKGGDVFNAEDFDIDFNQYTYLTESRFSGALAEPKTALVVERRAA